MRAPTRERWLRIFRRQIELGKIEVDPEERPALIALLTKAIDGTMGIPAEAMAALPKVWGVFDRNVKATLGTYEPLWRMFRPDVPGDRKKAIAVAFSLAQQATLKELGPVLSGADGARKTKTKRRAKADAKWRNEAERLAIEIVKEGTLPLSDLALAGQIMKRWPEHNDACPSDRTLTRMIAEMRGKKSLDT